MSLDGRMLARLSEEMDKSLATGKIQKIQQLGKTDFLLSIRIAGKNEQMILSLSSSSARVHLTDLSYDKLEVPGGFCMLLRKYCEGGVIQRIRSVAGDRLIDFVIENRDEAGDQRTLHLFIELMGRSNNLILTDETGQIIDAFRHVSPTETSGRTIIKGATYHKPLDDKIAPDDVESANDFFQKNASLSAKSLVNHFRGFSPLIANYFMEQLNYGQTSPGDLFRMLQDIPTNPTLYLGGEKPIFYFFDLFPQGDKRHFPTLSKLLEHLFQEASQSERVRQLTKNLLQIARRELDKNAHKLEKLMQDLTVGKQADILRIKGSMILEHLDKIHQGNTQLIAPAYELGKDIEIDLDPTRKPLENANQYFHKYKKAKASVGHLESQLNITRQQIDYYTMLLTQIEMASSQDLEEIAVEMAQVNQATSRSKTTKKTGHHYDSYQDPDHIEILVGKNNLQNRTLTQELAGKDEWWFHCKDHPGAHVIVRTTAELKEATIRMAAQLAAIHSPERFSSSVPVDYTRIRYVRRLPGESGAKVSYTHQKTIYIDPDLDWFEQLKNPKK